MRRTIVLVSSPGGGVCASASKRRGSKLAAGQQAKHLRWAAPAGRSSAPFQASQCSELHGRTDRQTALNIACPLTASTREAEVFLKWLDIKTGAILEKRWPLVELLAKDLLARNTIEGKEVDRLLCTHIHRLAPEKRHAGQAVSAYVAAN
jgi:hypothetical protein